MSTRTTAFLLALLGLSLLGLGACAWMRADGPPPYRRAELPIAERVDDLLARMTLEEKVAQVLCIWPRASVPVEAEEVKTEGPARRVVGLAPDQPTYRILVVEDRLENRLLNGVVGPIAPESGPNVYELRCYRLRPGAMKSWLGLFTGALPIREKYSKIVGLWSADAGQPNEVCHIWAYPGLDARAEVRAKVGADPEWRAFVAEGGEMIEDMASTIMLPFRHSPLQ